MQIFELSMKPVAFSPTAYQDGAARMTLAETLAAAVDVKKIAKRWAAVSRGQIDGLTYNRDATAYTKWIKKNRGCLAILDGEDCRQNNLDFYGMLQAFRAYAPGQRVSTYDFMPLTGEEVQALDLPLLEQAVEILRPRFESVIPYLPFVDFPDISGYLGDDNGRPLDLVRDGLIGIARLNRLIEIAHLLWPGQKIATCIWPRMLFSEYRQGSTGQKEVPDAIIPKYIKAATKADIITVFDLRPTDYRFIRELKKYLFV